MASRDEHAFSIRSDYGKGNCVALMLGHAKDDSAADSIDSSDEYIYSYASPSTYHPNSNPNTILTPPPPHYYASPSTYHPNSNPTTTLSPPPPYSYASPSTYHPNSNPTTILSPPHHHPYANDLIVMIEKERADNFLMAKEALNASIKGDGGAFDIETSMKAAAPFSLTEAEALHYCLTTKVLDHGCPSPARAALCSKKCLSIFSSICSD